VEPGRKRLLVRERTTVDGRLDLHGLDYDRARAALRVFVARSVAEGWRHILIITGKGYEGEGVLRRFTPVWLAEPGVREHVAGVSPAHRRHGGDGALYVALKARR
jgi:DNA-nicking Smr family endonuclease